MRGWSNLFGGRGSTPFLWKETVCRGKVGKSTTQKTIKHLMNYLRGFIGQYQLLVVVRAPPNKSYLDSSRK